MTLLKCNKERWHTNLRLIHEKGMFKIYNQNINNGIFQGDSLSPLFICIVLISLSKEVKIQPMDLKQLLKNKPLILYGWLIYAKNDDDLEGLLSTGKRIIDYRGMLFGMEKMCKSHI